MSGKLIFLPVLLQILLTLYAYVRLAIEKARASKAGLVDAARRGLHDDAWPDNVLQINNNIRNQFELPVLFYVLVLMLYALESAAQFVAWLFVLSRIAHLAVHTGSNLVPLRRRIFTVGAILIVILLVTAFVAVCMH